MRRREDTGRRGEGKCGEQNRSPQFGGSYPGSWPCSCVQKYLVLQKQRWPLLYHGLFPQVYPRGTAPPGQTRCHTWPIVTKMNALSGFTSHISNESAHVRLEVITQGLVPQSCCWWPTPHRCPWHDASRFWWGPSLPASLRLTSTAGCHFALHWGNFSVEPFPQNCALTLVGLWATDTSSSFFFF